MFKNLSCFLILHLFLLGETSLFSQVVSSQNAFYIAELQAAQSKVTNTFVSCSMRRLKYNLTSDEQVLIHRSDDQTASWTLIETFVPQNGDRYIDPVMTTDEAGNFYVVFMRIEHSSRPISDRSTSLDLYRSTDDGMTWQFMGTPYSGYFPDYPQIMSTGNGQLFMVFADFLEDLSSIVKFMTSTDGGVSWSSPLSFPFPHIATDGGGLEDLKWGHDSTLILSFGNSEFKGPCVTKSFDKGLTWSPYIWGDLNNTSANTAILSKIVSHPDVDFYGVFAHRPHFANTPMTFHFEKGNALGTIDMGEGAYAETILTADSIIHLVYNYISNDTFQVVYRASGNQGWSFTDPIVLFQAPNQITERGEYQSLILGADNQFYLTFCDGSDSSMAKSIVFPPLNIEYNPIPISTPTIKFSAGEYQIFPNPVRQTLNLKTAPKGKLEEIWIRSTNGANVMQLNSNNPNNSWNVSGLAEGVYWLHLKERNRYLVQPFIKTGH